VFTSYRKPHRSFDRICLAKQGLKDFGTASQSSSFLEQIASRKAPEVDVEVDTANAGFFVF
jgi:hypothetical protein